MRTAVVEWAVEWAVKKHLGREQKAADYLLFLGKLCLEAPCLAGLFDPFAPLGAPGTTPVCLQQPKNFQVGYNKSRVAARSHCLKCYCLNIFLE